MVSIICIITKATKTKSPSKTFGWNRFLATGLGPQLYYKGISARLFSCIFCDTIKTTIFKNILYDCFSLPKKFWINKDQYNDIYRCEITYLCYIYT